MQSLAPAPVGMYELQHGSYSYSYKRFKVKVLLTVFLFLSPSTK